MDARPLMHHSLDTKKLKMSRLLILRPFASDSVHPELAEGLLIDMECRCDSAAS